MPDRKLSKPLLWTTAALVLVGSLLLGYLLVVPRSEGGCEGLLQDKSVQRVIGATGTPDLSCADLGTALRDATTGSAPGRHTLAQARNMQAVVLAVSDDVERRGQPDLAEELRRPLAEAFAGYAADIHEIVGGINTAYYAGKHRTPWEDDDGIVRMPVPEPDLLRALRAVSGNPSAYAELRIAQTRQCADLLAAVTVQRVGDIESWPAKVCGAVFGHLDGIADDLRRTEDRSGSEHRAWEAAVFRYVARSAPEPPPYREDSAGHIAGTWQRRFVGAEPPPTGFLREDVRHIIQIWAKGRGEDPHHKGVTLLTMDARNSEYTGRRGATKVLECTTDPRRRVCP